MAGIEGGTRTPWRAVVRRRGQADAEVALLPQDEEQPEVTCGAGNIRVEATNSGSNANYTTLQLAFAAINAGTHTGVINIGVCADTAETASAVLNASGTGAASYT